MNLAAPAQGERATYGALVWCLDARRPTHSLVPSCATMDGFLGGIQISTYSSFLLYTGLMLDWLATVEIR